MSKDIENDEILYNIALSETRKKVREIAINKISSVQILLKLVKFAIDDETKIYCVKKINDVEDLLFLKMTEKKSIQMEINNRISELSN